MAQGSTRFSVSLALALLASAPVSAQDAGASIAGTWIADSVPTTVLTSEGKKPPMTAAGSEAYQANLADAKSDQPQFDRTRWCAGPGVPRIMFMATPFEIVVNPKIVGFMYGWYRWHRAVDMSGEPSDPLLPQPMGYPVGHWEGDTLVIVSNGLSGETIIDDSGLPHTDDMMLEERLKVDSGDKLHVRFRITDPEFYSAPWETEMTYHRAPAGQRVEDDVCPDRIAAGEPAILREVRP